MSNTEKLFEQYKSMSPEDQEKAEQILEILIDQKNPDSENQ